MLMMLRQGPLGLKPQPPDAHDGQLMLMMLRQGPLGQQLKSSRPADARDAASGPSRPTAQGQLMLMMLRQGPLGQQLKAS